MQASQRSYSYDNELTLTINNRDEVDPTVATTTLLSIPFRNVSRLRLGKEATMKPQDSCRMRLGLLDIVA